MQTEETTEVAPAEEANAVAEKPQHANPLAAVIHHKAEALAELVGPDNLARFTGNVLANLKAKNAQGKPNKLLQCTPASFYAAAYQAALLNLQPGPFGECYLVPYGREATLLVGYKGMMKAAMRHPRVAKITAQLVYDGEDYHRDPATGVITHNAPLGIDRHPDNIVGAWCRVLLKDCAEPISDDMNRDQIEAVRARSAASEGNFWRNDYAAMSRKSVIRRLCNGGSVPASEDLQRVLEHEIAAEKAADVVAIRDEPAEPAPSRTAQLKAQLMEPQDQVVEDFLEMPEAETDA